MGVGRLEVLHRSAQMVEQGDLMLITDHIKIFMESPLRGENLPAFGPRFL